MKLHDSTNRGEVEFGDLRPEDEYFISEGKLYCHLREADLNMLGVRYNAFCVTKRMWAFLHSDRCVVPVEIDVVVFTKKCVL